MLGEALSDLMERHEVMRTTFPEADGVPRQHVLAAGAPPPLVVKATTLGMLAVDLATAADEPFKLAEEPAFRVHVFELGFERYVLQFVVHHLVIDAWSMRPLLNDLLRSYLARIDNSVPQAGKLPAQYIDYTLWQRHKLGIPSDVESPWFRQLSFWRGTLDQPRPPSHEDGVARSRPCPARVRIRVSRVVHQRLLAFSRENDVTLFAVGHMAIALLVSGPNAGG